MTASRSDRAAAVLHFYALNILLLLVVGYGYLTSVPAGTSFLGWVQTWLAFAANFAMWALVPLIVTLLTLFFRQRWLTRGVAVATFWVLNFFVYADSVIYQLWRFHFNGFVWNLLTTPGAGDSVTAGTATVATTAGIALLILAVEIGLIVWVGPGLAKRGLLPRLQTGWAFTGMALAVAGLIALDKGFYDVGDLRQDVEVMRLRHLLPLYQTVTMKRFAHRVLGVDVSPKSTIHADLTGASLDYPKTPLRLRPGGPRPNVVVIAIEGARFDVGTAAIMPNVHRWGEAHLVFDNHYSAGNTTRYGIFGLLYGIHGTYWQRALAEHHGPVMLRTLQQLGYQFRILSCTDLNFPEFRSTAFVDVPAAITDTWNCDRVDRDRHMTDAFIQFVKQKPEPFFAFMFYDASHQPYRYPPEHAVFDAGGLADTINYVRLTHDHSLIPVAHNRYRNSLHYIDAQIGRALDTLDQQGLLTNTIVFITGDHGEEFAECGMFGHDISFNRYQTQAVAVGHIPGAAPRHVATWTSHVDLPATVLDYIGVENPPDDYTQGQPLTADRQRPYLVIASWEIAAAVSPTTTISFGLAAYNAETVIVDTNNIPLPNQRQALAARKDCLVSVLHDMKQFTK